MKELEAFSPEVAARPQVLAANKVDLLGDDKTRLVRLRRMAARKKIPLFAISALKREGLKPLVEAVARMLENVRRDGRERRRLDGDHRSLRRDVRSHPSRAPAGRRRGPPPGPARPHPLHPVLLFRRTRRRGAAAPPADRLRMVELACRRRAGFEASSDRGGGAREVLFHPDPAQGPGPVPRGPAVLHPRGRRLPGHRDLARIREGPRGVPLHRDRTAGLRSRSGPGTSSAGVSGADRRRSADAGRLSRARAAPRFRIILVPIRALDISSTAVRDLARRGRSLDGLVPRAVAAYIREHELYRGR